MDVQIADDLVCAGFRRDRLLAPPRPGRFRRRRRQRRRSGRTVAIVIGAITALERLVGQHEVHKQVDGWLDERLTRLAG
jgi:hypothetical protein